MRILVTGSSGTIGTALCKELMKSQDVIGADWKINKWEKSVESVTIHIDLRDPKTIDKLPRNVDLVVHLAANPRVYGSVVNPQLARDNVLMSCNIMEFCRKNRLKVIVASSREIYGNSDKRHYKEDDARIAHCESPYAASKVYAEALAHAYKTCFGMEFIIIRFSNVYGKYDDTDRVVPLFLRRARKAQELVVYGRKKAFNFTYIDDAVRGIILCIDNFEKAKNHTINLASSSSTEIVKVAELIKAELNSESKIVVKDSRPGEVESCSVDMSLASSLLNFKPETGIEEGIKKTVEWYNKH